MLFGKHVYKVAINKYYLSRYEPSLHKMALSLCSKKWGLFEWLCLIAMMWLFLVPQEASAHFTKGTQVRQFVIADMPSSTEVYVRTPIPLLFGDVLSSNKTDEEGFLINRGTVAAPKLFLSTDRIQNNRAAFTKRLMNSLEWQINGKPVDGRIRAYRIIHARPSTPLVSVAAAKQSLAAPSSQGEIEISRGVIDLLITLPLIPAHERLTLQAGFPAIPLADDVSIENQFNDVSGEERLSYTRIGQLEHAMSLPRTNMGMLFEYIYQGIVHILEGIDHIFLIIAMALGAARIGHLLRAVTAFSVGHMITLAAGFLGYVPTVAWFIPAVEAAIAATIVVAAIASFRKVSASSAIYLGIGLLHGFGFSFVLGDLLGHNSPDLIFALSAFTVGIEVGQLAILGGVLAIMAIARHFSASVENVLRLSTLGVLCLFGIVMMLSRIPQIITM